MVKKEDIIAEGWSPHEAPYLSDSVFYKGKYKISLMNRYGQVWITKQSHEKAVGNYPPSMEIERIYAGLCPDKETLVYLSKLLEI